MIARSEVGPRCPHCGRVNPAITLEAGATGCTCIHCQKPFNFWIEKLPFYCTDDGRGSRCECKVCTGQEQPKQEIEP